MDDAFGHWLAGFADGEGSFLIGANGRGARYCAFRIALHHGDEPILREAAERTGIGKVWVNHSPSQKSPAAMWTVSRKADCLKLVELFERYPLRAKKRRDFEIWARAVREHQKVRRGVPYGREAMDALRRELRAGRPNRGPKVVIS